MEGKWEVCTDYDDCGDEVFSVIKGAGNILVWDVRREIAEQIVREHNAHGDLVELVEEYRSFVLSERVATASQSRTRTSRIDAALSAARGE